MLSVVVDKSDGLRLELSGPLTMVINSDYDVPADDFAVTVPYNALLSDAQSVQVFEQDKLIFDGRVDEIVNVTNHSQALTKLTARSLAGMLLDNEAEPVTYINPSAQFIFNRHLKPFGIKSCDGDEVPFYGSLKIEKGMTHWQVLRNFCRNRYDALPRITGSGDTLMKGSGDDEPILFGSGGIPYFSLKESRRLYKLISEIKLKLNEFGEYDGSIKNENSECRGLERVRYVNAATDKTTIKTADKMIENSNQSSYVLALECPGCQLDALGRRAAVNDRLLSKIDDLRVITVRYTLSRDGEYSSVVLRKEKFGCG